MPPALKRAVRTAQWAYRLSTAAFRILPDFLIIGAQRSGTTSLHFWLQHHPRVGSAMIKEVHFFDLNFHRGPIWYRAHFPVGLPKSLHMRSDGSPLVTGEATPNYLFHAESARRAAALIPRAKLIALLRNPISRAYSHYLYEVRRGREPLSFEEAIEKEAERLRPAQALQDKDQTLNYRRYAYLTRGIYADQLENWLRSFPREQLLIIHSEEYFRSPSGVQPQLLHFLGLPGWDYQPPHHTPHSYEPMSRSTRERLRDFFAPHNQRLYRLAGRDFGWDG